MELIRINQVDFEIAVNSFHDEVMNRLDFLSNIEIQFLRRYQCQINVPETHASLVNYLRNMISTLEQTYKDVQSYFADLGITFAYQFFRKIQLLMVSGYNFLAQALVIHIDQLEQDRNYRAKSKEIELIIPKKMVSLKDSRGSAAELKNFDYAINFFQNEQSKLSQELHKLQQNLMQSKGLVQRLHPSKAVKQLTQIKQRAEVTLQNTERIFEQTYQLKYLEFKQYLSNLQKPEDLTELFCENIKTAMKEKFTNGMKKSMEVMYQHMKQNQIRKCVEGSCQTEEPQTQKSGDKKVVPSKNGEKMHTLLLRERKLNEKLLVDTQILKKQNQNLANEKERLNRNLKELDARLEDSQANYKILTNIYEQKREQADRLSKEIIRKDGNIQRLKKYQFKYLERYTTCEFAVQVHSPSSIVDQHVQTHLQDNQIISILKKTNERMGERIREKQCKIKQTQKRHIYEKSQKLRRIRIFPKVVSQHLYIDKSTTILKDPEQQEEDQILIERRISSISEEEEIPASQIQLLQLQQQQKLQPKERRPNMPIVRTTKGAKNNSTRLPLMTNKKPHQITRFATSQQNQSASDTSDSQLPMEMQEEYGIDCEIQTDPIFIDSLKIEVSSKAEPLRNMKRIKMAARANPIDILTQRLNRDKSRKALYFDNAIQSESSTDNKNAQLNCQYPSANLKSAKSKVYDSNEDSRQIAEQTRNKRQHFQPLNIQTEQLRASLEKKMALSKNFLNEVANNKKKDAAKLKKTIQVEEFYRDQLHRQENNINGNNIAMPINNANPQIYDVRKGKKKSVLFDISSKKVNKGFSLKENKEISAF